MLLFTGIAWSFECANIGLVRSPALPTLLSIGYPAHILVYVQFLELRARVQVMFFVVAVGTVWFGFGGLCCCGPTLAALFAIGSEEECCRLLLRSSITNPSRRLAYNITSVD